jgi:hypothetical protein
MKIKPKDVIRWVLTVIMLVLMWRGNKFCLYYFVTGSVIAFEVLGKMLDKIARIIKKINA